MCLRTESSLGASEDPVPPTALNALPNQTVVGVTGVHGPGWGDPLAAVCLTMPDVSIV